MDDQLIDITLTDREGKIYSLQPPTARNMLEASSRFGAGLNEFLRRCAEGDGNCYLWILQRAGKTGPDGLPANGEALQDLLFANMAAWSIPLCRWANALQYGGRAPATVKDLDDAKNQDGAGEEAQAGNAASA